MPIMKHRNRAPGWLLAIFFLLASSYSIVNPIFEAPDEVWHYELVRWLAEGKGLPAPEDIDDAPWQQEGAQPPLYYLAAAALTKYIPTDNAAEVIRYNPHAAVGNADAPNNKNIMAHGPWEAWPWQGVVLAVHLARLLSVLLGMLTVYFTWRAAAVLFATSTEIPLLAALLVALNPQFLFLSASVTNDSLVTCCAAIAIWQLLLMLRVNADGEPLPTASALLRLGLILGAAALSKVSGLALSGLAGLVLLLLAWQRRSVWELLRMSAWVALSAGAVALWWYWRNWQLFGDPLALNVLTSVLPGRDVVLSWQEIFSLVPGVWRSYWGVFGWFNILMAAWLYSFYSWLSLLALVGLLFGMRQLAGKEHWAMTTLLLVWILTISGLLVRWAQINYPQGRLLFPAIGAVAIFLAYGLLNWLPQSTRRGATFTLAALLFVPAAVAPWRWIAPTYQPPALVSAVEIQQQQSTRFGDLLLFNGFSESSDIVATGEDWSITLYWSALQPVAQDYSIFVHLTDENGIIQAQSDSFPAGGLLPTRALPVGQIVPDSRIIRIPPSLPASSHLKVSIGVYDHLSGERLIVNGQDSLSLAVLAISERSASAESTAAINFDNLIELSDYHFERMLVAAGDPLRVDLTWRAMKDIDRDYVVFVHLLLPPDAVWAQVDEAPQQGKSPTSSWRKDQVIQDSHTIAIPPQIPAGVYQVEIGLYDMQTMDRLKVGLEDAGVAIGLIQVR